MAAKYKVFVDDNFHYHDEDERYLAGEYETEEEALSAARRIVDDFLQDAYRPGMTAEVLYDCYVSFGEDPFIVPAGEKMHFSAWEYAKARSADVCGR